MSVDFARDGHVLDLALERFVLEDLPDDERRAVKAHLRDCELCRGRAEQVRLDLAVPMPPLDATRITVLRPEQAKPAWIGALIGVVAALVVLAAVLWVSAG